MARQLKCECGVCETCQKREWWRKKTAKQKALKLAMIETVNYPVKHEVVVWECSDGREFSSELEAAYHQLNIYKSVATERRAA